MTAVDRQAPGLTRREALALTASAIVGAGLMPEGAHADPDISTMWDLTALYPTPDAWTVERASVLATLPRLLAFKNRLGDGAATLGAALRLRSDLARRTDRLNTYATLKNDEDLRDPSGQERSQLADDLDGAVKRAGAWIEPELLALGPGRLGAEFGADPSLSRFRFFLADLERRAPHIRDAETETLLAAADTPLDGTESGRDQLVGADMPWPEIVLAGGGRVRLGYPAFEAHRVDRNRDDRAAVYRAFFGTFRGFEGTLGELLSARLQANIFKATAHRYPSALAAALGPNAIPEAAYRTMVAEADAGLPVLHRYLDMRRRMLGLSELTYHDLYVPVAAINPPFDIARSRRNVVAAVAPLGAPYAARLAEITAAGWMDAYPRPGKQSGGFMNPGAYDVHPYVLLNHTGDYEGMTSLAHEFGHAMHSVLDDANQPYELSRYPIFVAEIASTVNEQLLAEHMVRTAATRDEKLFFLVQLCELLRTTFFRQAMLGEFELRIYEAAQDGQALTGARFTALFLDLLRRYHGPNTRIDPLYGIEWASIGHFYYDFYVYQYATSIAAATLFVDRILAGGASERETYLDVLRAGGSDHPTAILRRAGLDMTTPAPYRALVSKLDATLDAIERLTA